MKALTGSNSVAILCFRYISVGSVVDRRVCLSLEHAVLSTRLRVEHTIMYIQLSS